MPTATRRQIIEILKRTGAQDAAALADQLGVSAMAVRQHLYSLVAEGLVESATTPDGVGRPAKQWRLTAAADDFFPAGYAVLTAELLSSMQEAFGAKGLDRVVGIRLRDQIAAYRGRLADARSLRQRIIRLAEIRTEEGYMAEVSKEANGYLFTENHCPICAAARTCTGLCAAELDLFKAVLGDNVSVERTEHILVGARRCAYRVVEEASA